MLNDGRGDGIYLLGIDDRGGASGYSAEASSSPTCSDAPSATSAAIGVGAYVPQSNESSDPPEPRSSASRQLPPSVPSASAPPVVIPISDYSWYDWDSTVTVYVTIPKLDTVPDEGMQCSMTDGGTGFTFSVLMTEGEEEEEDHDDESRRSGRGRRIRRELTVRPLFSRIVDAEIYRRKRGRDTAVLRLRKSNRSLKWDDIRAGGRSGSKKPSSRRIAESMQEREEGIITTALEYADFEDVVDEQELMLSDDLPTAVATEVVMSEFLPHHDSAEEAAVQVMDVYDAEVVTIAVAEAIVLVDDDISQSISVQCLE